MTDSSASTEGIKGRVFEISCKLTHPLPGVRRRAARNLCCKITAGLVNVSSAREADEVAAGAVSVLNLGGEGITDALALCSVLTTIPALRAALLGNGIVHVINGAAVQKEVDNCSGVRAQVQQLLDTLLQTNNDVLRPVSVNTAHMHQTHRKRKAPNTPAAGQEWTGHDENQYYESGHAAHRGNHTPLRGTHQSGGLAPSPSTLSPLTPDTDNAMYTSTPGNHRQGQNRMGNSPSVSPNVSDGYSTTSPGGSRMQQPGPGGDGEGNAHAGGRGQRGSNGGATVQGTRGSGPRLPAWMRDFVDESRAGAEAAGVRECLCGGWRFPTVALIKSDEAVLFELEVAFVSASDVPSLIDCCRRIRDDVLEDYPAEVLLQRTGLLGRLLSLMRASLGMSVENGSGQRQGHAHGSMALLEELLSTVTTLVDRLLTSVAAHVDPRLTVPKMDHRAVRSSVSVPSLLSFRYPQTATQQSSLASRLMKGEGSSPADGGVFQFNNSYNLLPYQQRQQQPLQLSVCGAFFSISCCTCQVLVSGVPLPIGLQAVALLNKICPFLKEPVSAAVKDESDTVTVTSLFPVDVMRFREYFLRLDDVVRRGYAICGGSINGGGGGGEIVTYTRAKNGDNSHSLVSPMMSLSLRVLQLVPAACLQCSSDGQMDNSTSVVVPPAMATLVQQTVEDGWLRDGHDAPSSVEEDPQRQQRHEMLNSLAVYLGQLRPAVVAELEQSRTLVERAEVALVAARELAVTLRPALSPGKLQAGRGGQPHGQTRRRRRWHDLHCDYGDCDSTMDVDDGDGDGDDGDAADDELDGSIGSGGVNAHGGEVVTRKSLSDTLRSLSDGLELLAYVFEPRLVSLVVLLWAQLTLLDEEDAGDVSDSSSGSFHHCWHHETGNGGGFGSEEDSCAECRRVRRASARDSLKDPPLVPSGLYREGRVLAEGALLDLLVGGDRSDVSCGEGLERPKSARSDSVRVQVAEVVYGWLAYVAERGVAALAAEIVGPDMSAPGNLRIGTASPPPLPPPRRSGSETITLRKEQVNGLRSQPAERRRLIVHGLLMPHPSPDDDRHSQMGRAGYIRGDGSEGFGAAAAVNEVLYLVLREGAYSDSGVVRGAARCIASACCDVIATSVATSVEEKEQRAVQQVSGLTLSLAPILPLLPLLELLRLTQQQAQQRQQQQQLESGEEKQGEVEGDHSDGAGALEMAIDLLDRSVPLETQTAGAARGLLSRSKSERVLSSRRLLQLMQVTQATGYENLAGLEGLQAHTSSSSLPNAAVPSLSSPEPVASREVYTSFVSMEDPFGPLESLEHMSAQLSGHQSGDNDGEVRADVDINGGHSAPSHSSASLPTTSSSVSSSAASWPFDEQHVDNLLHVLRSPSSSLDGKLRVAAAEQLTSMLLIPCPALTALSMSSRSLPCISSSALASRSPLKLPLGGGGGDRYINVKGTAGQGTESGVHGDSLCWTLLLTVWSLLADPLASDQETYLTLFWVMVWKLPNVRKALHFSVPAPSSSSSSTMRQPHQHYGGKIGLSMLPLLRYSYHVRWEVRQLMANILTVLCLGSPVWQMADHRTRQDVCRRGVASPSLAQRGKGRRQRRSGGDIERAGEGGDRSGDDGDDDGGGGGDGEEADGNVMVVPACVVAAYFACFSDMGGRGPTMAAGSVGAGSIGWLMSNTSRRSGVVQVGTRPRVRISGRLRYVCSYGDGGDRRGGDDGSGGGADDDDDAGGCEGGLAVVWNGEEDEEEDGMLRLTTRAWNQRMAVKRAPLDCCGGGVVNGAGADGVLTVCEGLMAAESHSAFFSALNRAMAWILTSIQHKREFLRHPDCLSSFQKFLSRPPTTLKDRLALLRTVTFLEGLVGGMTAQHACAIIAGVEPCFVHVLSTAQAPVAWILSSNYPAASTSELTHHKHHHQQQYQQEDGADVWRLRGSILQLLVKLTQRFPQVASQLQPQLLGTSSCVGLVEVLVKDYVLTRPGGNGQDCVLGGGSSGGGGGGNGSRWSAAVDAIERARVRLTAVELLTCMVRGGQRSFIAELASLPTSSMSSSSAAVPPSGSEEVCEGSSVTLLGAVLTALVDLLAKHRLHVPDSWRRKAWMKAVMTCLWSMLVWCDRTSVTVVSCVNFSLSCDFAWLSNLTFDREACVRALAFGVAAELLRLQSSLPVMQSMLEGPGSMVEAALRAVCDPLEAKSVSSAAISFLGKHTTAIATASAFTTVSSASTSAVGDPAVPSCREGALYYGRRLMAVLCKQVEASLQVGGDDDGGGDGQVYGPFVGPALKCIQLLMCLTVKQDTKGRENDGVEGEGVAQEGEEHKEDEALMPTSGCLYTCVRLLDGDAVQQLCQRAITSSAGFWTSFPGSALHTSTRGDGGGWGAMVTGRLEGMRSTDTLCLQINALTLIRTAVSHVRGVDLRNDLLQHTHVLSALVRSLVRCSSCSTSSSSSSSSSTLSTSAPSPPTHFQLMYTWQVCATLAQLLAGDVLTPGPISAVSLLVNTSAVPMAVLESVGRLMEWGGGRGAGAGNEAGERLIEQVHSHALQLLVTMLALPSDRVHLRLDSVAAEELVQRLVCLHLEDKPRLSASGDAEVDAVGLEVVSSSKGEGEGVAQSASGAVLRRLRCRCLSLLLERSRVLQQVAVTAGLMDGLVEHVIVLHGGLILDMRGQQKQQQQQQLQQKRQQQQPQQLQQLPPQPQPNRARRQRNGSQRNSAAAARGVYSGGGGGGNGGGCDDGEAAGRGEGQIDCFGDGADIYNDDGGGGGGDGDGTYIRTPLHSPRSESVVSRGGSETGTHTRADTVVDEGGALAQAQGNGGGRGSRLQLTLSVVTSLLLSCADAQGLAVELGLPQLLWKLWPLVLSAHRDKRLQGGAKEWLGLGPSALTLHWLMYPLLNLLHGSHEGKVSIIFTGPAASALLSAPLVTPSPSASPSPHTHTAKRKELEGVGIVPRSRKGTSDSQGSPGGRGGRDGAAAAAAAGGGGSGGGGGGGALKERVWPRTSQTLLHRIMMMALGATTPPSILKLCEGVLKSASLAHECRAVMAQSGFVVDIAVQLQALVGKPNGKLQPQFQRCACLASVLVNSTLPCQSTWPDEGSSTSLFPSPTATVVGALKSSQVSSVTSLVADVIRLAPRLLALTDSSDDSQADADTDANTYYGATTALLTSLLLLLRNLADVRGAFGTPDQFVAHLDVLGSCVRHSDVNVRQAASSCLWALIYNSERTAAAVTANSSVMESLQTSGCLAFKTPLPAQMAAPHSASHPALCCGNSGVGADSGAGINQPSYHVARNLQAVQQLLQA